MLQIVPVDKIPITATDCPLEEDQLVDVHKICREMHVVCEEESGIGLSAVQVGIPWRLFVIKCDNHYQNYLNCTYGQVGETKFESLEGCLSLRKPDGTLRYFQVERFEKINLCGFRLIESAEGKLKCVRFQVQLQGKNLTNVVFQHEIDHQNQILISDFGKEVVASKYDDHNLCDWSKDGKTRQCDKCSSDTSHFSHCPDYKK